MAIFIHQHLKNLIKKLAILTPLLLLFLFGCNEQTPDKRFPTMKYGEIQLPTGQKMKAWISITEIEQKKGLSFLKKNEFAEDEAMLFFDLKDTPRQFWMPDTFFNLDIIFLTKDLYVIDIHRDIQHFTRRTPHHEVPRSKTVRCRHVLEIRADSRLSQHVQVGSQLKWISEPSLEKIEQGIRQMQ